MKKRIAPEFFKNSFYNFSSFAINHLGGLIFTIILARIFNPEVFGTYSLTLSVIAILMTLGDLGLNEAMMKYVSSNFNNNQKAKSYFIYLLKFKIFVLLSLSAILMLCSKLIAIFYNNEPLSYLLILGGFYLFFYSMMQFISTLLYAFKNIKAYVYKEFIFQTIRICLIPFLLIFSFGYLAAGPIIFIIISSIITIIFLIIYLLRKYPNFFKSKKIRIDKKELFNFIKYLSLSSLSIIFLVNTDILILGKFVTLEFVGFYKVAASISMLFASFLTLTAILYPIFAQINKKKTREIFDIILYYLFILSIPMVFGVLILSKQIILILFGESYIQSVAVLLVLSLLIIVLPLGELFRTLINSKGKSKLTGKTILYASFLNIVLNIILIYLFLMFFQKPIYAALGAGIATVISWFFIFFSLAKISKSRFNTRIKPLFIIKPFIAGIIMAIFLSLLIKYVYSGINIILIVLEIIPAIIIYFIALYFIKGISKNEINYIINIIQEIFKNKPLKNKKIS